MALRVIVAENRIMNSIFAPGTSRTCLVRWPITFGSGNSNSLQVLHNGFYANDSTATLNMPNSFDIVSESIEYNSISVPITYAGQRTKTILATDADVKSDAVTPSAFSASSFVQGTVGWYKLEVLLPSDTASIMFSSRKNTSHKTGSQTLYLNKANTTITTGVDAVGVFATSGTAPTTATGQGYCPMFVGNFVSGDPKTIVFAGDSITEGAGDTVSPSPVGVGLGQRVLYGDGTNILAGMNISRSGSFGYNFTTSPGGKLHDLAKYCTHGHLFFGANDFGLTGTNNSLSTFINTERTNATALRAKGVTKILHPALLTRTTAGSGTSEAGQTISGPGWDVGGNAQTFNNTSIAAEIALGTFDYTVNFTVARGTDTTKWFVNGTNNFATGDGTHTTTSMTSLMAPQERAVFDLMETLSVASPFTLNPVTGAAVSSPITSNTITVAGITSSAAISITGAGTYSKNGGAFTSSAGTVVAGDTVAVRITSSGSNSTPVNTTLTIGTESSTFTVTTAAAVVIPEEPEVSELPVVNLLAYSNSAPPTLITLGSEWRQQFRIWSHVSSDPVSLVAGPGYFSLAYTLGIRAGDYILFTKTSRPMSVTLHSVESVIVGGSATISPAITV